MKSLNQSESVTKKEAQSVSIDQEIAQYWGHFRMFPTRWEEALFSHFGYMVGVALITLSVLCLEALVFGLYSGTGFEQVRQLFTVYYLPLHVISIGLIFIIWPFVRWKHRVPGFFQDMLMDGRLGAVNEGLMLDYLGFLRDFQRLLHSRYRIILVAVFIALVLGVNMALGVPQFLFQKYLQVDFLGRLSTLSDLTLWIFGPLVWMIFMALAAWVILVTGLFVFRLPRHFEITIHPRHQDRCGGLKPVGSFSLDMTLPSIVGGVILVVIAIIYNIWSGDALNLISQAVYLALFIMFLPLTSAAFFLPTWNFHRVMVAYKNEAELRIASRMLELDERIRSFLGGDVGIEDAIAAKEELEVLEAIHPDQLKYPVWPFRGNILWGVFSPQFLGLAVGFLSQLITDWLTKR